jgi:AraC-like DNA-binding protein
MLISSPQYGPLILIPVNPDNLPGLLLPGSNTFMCQHDFGSIIIQEIDTQNYYLRYFILSLIKKVTLVFRDEQTAMKVKLSLESNLTIKIGKKEKRFLKEGQFIIINGNENIETTYLEKNKEYRLFDAAYPVHALQELVEVFPSLSNFIGKNSNKNTLPIAAHPHYSSGTMTQIVYDLLKCPYNENLRKVYFENKVTDFLFELLAESDKHQANIIASSPGESEAVSKARDIILRDLKKHLTIREISQQVQLNEFKLKAGFKKEFSMGMFEYLLQARMLEARRLILETDKPLKEIASLTGYEYFTNFIAAFRNYFSYTPASLRRKR